MKTIILAGGLGTRLSEETTIRPKPLVEIGGRPILWHIMNIYAAAGFNEFIIALGYKGEMIKKYFLNFHALSNDCTIDLSRGKRQLHGGKVPNWKIHLVDTGEKTMTGGRVKRLQEWIGNETFMLTYGDGVANVNIGKLVEFHRNHGRLATVTAVQSPPRFGGISIKDGLVTTFSEKPQTGEGWINGGFFVFEPAVLNYINDDSTILERSPMEHLARDKQLMAYCHTGFWQPMDTIREKSLLESLWQSGTPPWCQQL